MTKRIGRPKGTTLARKDIYEEDVNQLIREIESSNMKVKEKAIKAFHLLYYFGFRAGELSNLKNKHIQQMAKENLLSLANNTKTKTPRDAYISEENANILKEIFKDELEEDEKYTLFSPTKNRFETYNSSALIKMLNNILKKTLGKQYSTHSFRAGYITTLHRAGVSIPVIQEVIGHKKPNTTMRYITVEVDEKRRAVTKVR